MRFSAAGIERYDAQGEVGRNAQAERGRPVRRRIGRLLRNTPLERWRPLRDPRSEAMLSVRIENVLREARAAGRPYSDVFISCHGWMNDTEDAVHSYERWLSMADRTRPATLPDGFAPLVIGIHWPSKPVAGRRRVEHHPGGRTPEVTPLKRIYAIVPVLLRDGRAGDRPARGLLPRRRCAPGSGEGRSGRLDLHERLGAAAELPRRRAGGRLLPRPLQARNRDGCITPSARRASTPLSRPSHGRR